MRKIFSSILYFTILISLSFATMMTSEKYKYSIDFPEGFEMVDGTEDESMFLFASDIVPVQVLLKVSENEKSAEEFLRANLKKLNAMLTNSVSSKNKLGEIIWRRKKVSIAQFTMQNQIFTETQQGIAVCVPCMDNKSFLTLIAFCPKKSFYQCECFISSIIDSLVMDMGGFREAGIITSQKYPIDDKKTFPVELTICDEKISTKLNKIDSFANQYVVDREFEVFKTYAISENPNISKFSIFAWQRFYRMIEKDSLARLKKAAFDINSSLQEIAIEKDSENPDAAIAQMLLNWVQTFEYKRESTDTSKADFNNLPSVLQNQGSDCDSRSLLVAVLLKNMGLDTCIFLSSEFSHALVGVVLDKKQGQFIELETLNGKKKYLLGDTTIKDSTFGTIAASQAPITQKIRNKWIEVEYFY